MYVYVCIYVIHIICVYTFTYIDICMYLYYTHIYTKNICTVNFVQIF